MAFPEDRLSAITETRTFAAACVADVLRQSEGLSERDCAALIHEKLAANPALYPEGWYRPPQHGVAVLAATEDTLERLRFDSLRKAEFHPRPDIIIGPESVVMAYASPVHRETLAIGDFGLTFYRGTDPRYRAHIGKALDLLRQIADRAAPGMRFSELCAFGQNLFDEHNVTNARALLTTQPSAALNLGHTVPWSFADDPAPEPEGDMDTVLDALSKARIFVNGDVDFAIPDTCAFTVEARLEDKDDSTLPNAFWHLIVSFERGEKTVHGVFPIKGTE